MPKSIINLNDIVLSLISQKYDSEYIRFFQADNLTVKTVQPYAWTLDGEASAENTEVHIRVIHKALRLRG